MLSNREVLDFASPALHRYKRSGVELHFPSIPEDDVMDAYTDWYVPRPGDTVWDVGAHAGATSYFLSQLVGDKGKVYAFEPDPHNYEYLLRNIEMHHLGNVIPVKKALAGHTGDAVFNADGTMCAGISDYLVYSDGRTSKTVQTLTISDACDELGEIPVYIKMDIEGAEVAAVEGGRDFLSSHPIQFAIESYHRVHNEYTFRLLERLFPKIGYDVHSSREFGQMFTWARPSTPGAPPNI
jgi:FkbM family methyltransferase